MQTKKSAAAHSAADKFNRTNKIGTGVSYHGGTTPLLTKTRTLASVASSGDPVVFLEGVTGYVHLEAVEVIK